MSILCPNCGNHAPEGSAFCNRCGTPLNNLPDGQTACPHCHEAIPAESVFCPICGRMVRNDMAPDNPQPLTYNEQRRLQQQQQQAEHPADEYDERQRPPRQQQQPERPTDEYDEQATSHYSSDYAYEDVDSNEPAHFNRNLLIGIAVVAVLVGILTLMRNCGSDNDETDTSNSSDSTAVVNFDDNRTALDIFNSELSRHNLTGDGAIPAAAVRINGNGPENPDRILGITYQSNAANRSFFKIYQLTRSGSFWTPENLHTQYINGRTITLDRNALMTAEEVMPRAVEINGKEYLFFAFMNMPGSEGSRGRVTLALFDTNDRKLTTLDYDGPTRTRDDGRQYVYGKPLQSIGSKEARFLENEAKNIKIIYFPTEEELQAEEEARLKEEEEKALAGPENAAAKWNHDNAENMQQLRQGQDVTLAAPSYDKPIFNFRDRTKQVDSERYMVFIDNRGCVYGFNKDTRRYFVVYAPQDGGSGASDIGFGDVNTTLRMRTSDGHIVYDLPTGKAHLLND